MTSTRRLILLFAVAALVLAPACKEAAEEESEGGYEPATVEPIEGSDELSRVILTEDAAGLIRLETAPVTSVGDALVVPEAAVWIDTEGREWVYTATEPLTFVRAEIVVDRYEGDQALLISGPPTGTDVVTVGVAELIGSEFGI